MDGRAREARRTGFARRRRKVSFCCRIAARSSTFWLLVAKWLCHKSVNRSPSGSGVWSIRQTHQAFSRSGFPEPAAASASTVEVDSNSSGAWP